MDLMTENLPMRTKSHVVDDQATALVKKAVAKKGWIYRDLPEDYGLDAEIEIVKKRGSVTGALIRLQIKGTRTDRGKIRLKSTTARYLSVSLIPVLLIDVNVTTGAIRALPVEQGHLTSRKPTAKTISVSMKGSFQLSKGWKDIKKIAVEHQTSILDINRYTLYNASAQLIRYIDLLINFGGDADIMLKWMRAFAPDDALTSNYGYAVHLRDQLKNDPKLLDRLRLLVMDFYPELEKKIDKSIALQRSGGLSERARQVVAISYPHSKS